MGTTELIARVAALAEQQHGLIRTDQVSSDDLHRLRHQARRGVLVRVAKGVYRVSGAPVTWRQELQVGVWSLGPSCVVSHRAAARLHGFDLFEDDTVEFTIERGARGRRPATVACGVHTTAQRGPGDQVFIDGLPTTSAVRTIIDLARSGVGPVELEAAVDSALRQRLTTLDLILGRLIEVQGPGRRGLGRLYPVLTSAGGHSVLERKFLDLVATAGLPTPTPQVVHRREGRHVARVDFEFVGAGVVVEVSGGRGHSSASERAKDARRRNELQRLGKLVLEFTFEQIVHEPAAVIDTLRETLAERALRGSA